MAVNWLIHGKKEVKKHAAIKRSSDARLRAIISASIEKFRATIIYELALLHEVEFSNKELQKAQISEVIVTFSIQLEF